MQNTELNCDPTDGSGVSLNGCIIASGLLPVEFNRFEAKTKDKTVALIWETASETNNEGFVIERSLDGRSFEAIDFVEGQGNSFETTEYFYEDYEVAKGQIYYYRLKQLDFDGKYEYSEIVSAMLESVEPVIGEFYPNPSFGITYVDTYCGKNVQWNIHVFDLSGRLVNSKTYDLSKGRYKMDFDFSGLITGLYFVRFETDTEAFTRKLSIQYK